jgi:hypothetical protein
MLPDPALQPRIGPTHAINQIAGPNGMLYFVKFGNVATLETGRAYEMWAYDDNWIYQLEDASGSPPCSFSDPRMYPRHMQIGEQHAFKTGPHEAIFRQRDSHCEEIRRDPWDRKMWLEAVWDEFNWGPDLKIRATAMLVYDDTAQAEIQGRFVETGFYGAAGASGCRWRAYHAEGVYPNGPQHGAVFPDSAISSQSDFYLLGGPSPRADLTGCVAPVCPHLPALVVTPPAPPMPTPVPTPTPLPPAQPVGGSMRAYVKTAQFYTGINPTAQTKDLHGHPLTGDAQFPIYFNRPGQKNEGGGWETAELTPHDGGQFDVRYVDSNRQLSVDQFGAMTSRAAGAIGSDELFYATTQPDGSNLLYRFQNGVLVSTVLTLEAKQ